MKTVKISLDLEVTEIVTSKQNNGFYGYWKLKPKGQPANAIFILDSKGNLYAEDAFLCVIPPKTLGLDPKELK